MKYEVIVYRTYATSMLLDADSIGEAVEITLSSSELYEQELEQCDIVSTETKVRKIED